MPTIRGEQMDLESALLWFSRISFVFWTGILIWCGASIGLKYQKEKKWFSRYVPTLQSDIRETEIKSWITLDELGRVREETLSKRSVRDRREGSSELTSERI